jgi:hypothetical protein
MHQVLAGIVLTAESVQQLDAQAVDPEFILVLSPASEIIEHLLGPWQTLGPVAAANVSAQGLSLLHPLLSLGLVAVLKAIAFIDEDELDGEGIEHRVELVFGEPVDHAAGHHDDLHRFWICRQGWVKRAERFATWA